MAVALAPTMSEIAGYHLYWTLPFATTSDARALTKGPLLDANGDKIVIPAGMGHLHLRELVPDLFPGTYRLMPVDAAGRELPLGEPIETEVVDRQLSEALRSVLETAGRVFLERVHADPELTAAMADVARSPDWQNIMARALQMGDPGLWLGLRPHEPLDEVTHQRLVKSSVERLIVTLRAVTGLDARGATFRLDRESYEALLRTPALITLDHIRAAIGRADHGDAAVRALVRLSLGETLPADVLADILCGVERLDVFLVLVRHASGNRLGALHSLLAKNRLPSTWEGSEQKALTLFALWQLGATQTQTRPVVRRWLRRLLREVATERAAGLLAWLVTDLDEPDVHQVASDVGLSAPAGMPEAMGALAGDLLLHGDVEEVVAGLPERAEAPRVGGVVRRAPKIRPNEPCPCGSGKKYKRCHAELDERREAAIDRSTLMRALSPRLAPEQLKTLARADLAHLDLPKLSDATLVAYLRHQLDLGDWKRALAALDEVAKRPDVLNEDYESLRWNMVDAAFRSRLWPIIKELAERLPPGEADDAEQLILALGERRPDALDRLLRLSHRLIADDDAGSINTLAHILLSTVPPLGILVARGAMRADELDRAAVILRTIEEVRDDLLLSPRDPAHDLFDLLGGVRERQAFADTLRKQVSAEAERLRSQLEAKTARLTELEREAARRAQELREAERVAAEASQRAVPSTAGESRANREKVERLEALVREKNAQLAEARRGLAAATATTSAPAASPSIVTEPEDVAS